MNDDNPIISVWKRHGCIGLSSQSGKHITEPLIFEERPMTDAINKQATLNKLLERQILLEARINHLQEVAKEGFGWLEMDELFRKTAGATLESLYTSVFEQTIIHSVEEWQNCCLLIDELEESLAEQNARRE